MVGELCLAALGPAKDAKGNPEGWRPLPSSADLGGSGPSLLAKEIPDRAVVDFGA
jgi:hypothetical protein